MNSVLVIFGRRLPRKNKQWLKRFSRIIASRELENGFDKIGFSFVALENFVDPGSIHEAFDLVNQVSKLTLSNGTPLPKSINYRDYDLWWMHYDSIYNNFCLPFTQYGRLLSRLKDFDEIYLFQPPYADLFKYYLKAHKIKFYVLSNAGWRRFMPLPFGVILQITLSGLFLPWLIVRRSKLMVWVSDKFAPPHKCDFRMIITYAELNKRKIQFVEFIRSMESWRNVLNHAWQRKRPVFYSTAVILLVSKISSFFNRGFQKKLVKLTESDDLNTHFWLLAGTHYISNIRGSIWSIQLMRFLMTIIGVKLASLNGGCNRTFHELVACRMSGIKTIGIQHGAQTKSFCVYDFMPGFNGKKQLTLDKYGLWSDWWKEYYAKNSRAYNLDQLCVAGAMRPLSAEVPLKSEKRMTPRILFVSEQLAVPEEVMPYIAKLLQGGNFELHFKFRPYRDGFELWLIDNQPDVYKEILSKAKIFRGTMMEAISQSDVVVGSHSTAVLEGLLQLKPIVFFWTNKWGDYFDMKSLDETGRFFVRSPEALIERVLSNVDLGEEDIRIMQEKFFGNPYQNGSKWLVDELEKHL